jgi:LacI family transcriptional regulator
VIIWIEITSDKEDGGHFMMRNTSECPYDTTMGQAVQKFGVAMSNDLRDDVFTISF